MHHRTAAGNKHKTNRRDSHETVIIRGTQPDASGADKQSKRTHKRLGY